MNLLFDVDNKRLGQWKFTKGAKTVGGSEKLAGLKNYHETET